MVTLSDYETIWFLYQIIYHMVPVCTNLLTSMRLYTYIYIAIITHFAGHFWTVTPNKLFPDTVVQLQ